MKILLLSDATMCVDAGGVSQTLYNIFSYLRPEDILCVTPASSFKASPPSEPFNSSYITYQYDIISAPRNRLGIYMKPYIEWFNYQFNSRCRKFKSIKKQIGMFNPDFVISCSNDPVGLFMHHKLLQGLKVNRVIPYFMDDWMAYKKNKWLDRKVYQWTKKVLSDNPFWLMISMNLAVVLQKRYEIEAKQVLEIHNPVDLSNSPDVEPVGNKTSYTLVYAGALWQMHFDAFIIIARSVHQLNRVRDIKLVVYTSADFWKWRKGELEPLGVIYGGSISYKNIHQKLGEADALILCSSFSEESYVHSQGSLQTKITDYLKAKRLIISCGPAYSANHQFLKKHQCGVCIETSNIEAVTRLLNKILNDLQGYNSMVINGWEVLENEFSYAKVHSKLQNFLLRSNNKHADHLVNMDK